MTAAVSGRLDAHSEGAPVTIATGDIGSALAALARERPIFLDEADFQRDFARTLSELHPDIKVRTEYPVPWINPSGQWGSIDLWLRGADGAAAIELKYWTREAELVVDGKRYSFHELGGLERYEFWKDVERTERLVDKGHADGGYVVALANVEDCWGHPRRDWQETKGAAFRLHEGRSVEGPLDWAVETAPGTKKENPPLALRGRYVTSWRGYSRPASGNGGEFRYLLLDVAEGLRRTR